MSHSQNEDRQRWVTQLRKGLLELCILAVLRSRDGYGYLIVQQLKRIEGLTMTEGTVYPILQRLHREGCVSTYRMPSENGPPRKWFQLTHIGRSRLEQMEQQWRRLGRGVDLLLAGGLPQADTEQETP